MSIYIIDTFSHAIFSTGSKNKVEELEGHIQEEKNEIGKRGDSLEEFKAKWKYFDVLYFMIKQWTV